MSKTSLPAAPSIKGVTTMTIEVTADADLADVDLRQVPSGTIFNVKNSTTNVTKGYSIYYSGTASFPTDSIANTAQPNFAFAPWGSTGGGGVDAYTKTESDAKYAEITALNTHTSDLTNPHEVDEEQVVVGAQPIQGAVQDGRHPLARILLDSGLTNLYMMDAGASGDEDCYHRSTVATSFGNVAEPGNGTVSAAWGPARTFTATNQGFVSFPFEDVSAGFSAVLGLTITSLGIARAICGQCTAIPHATNEYNWFLTRDTDNKLTFQIKRDGGGSSFVLSSVVLSAATEYHVTVWYTPSDNEVGISVNGINDRAKASFGMDNANLVTMIGGAGVSGATNSNYHNGEIGYFALCKGQQDAALRTELQNYTAMDWQRAVDDLGLVHAWGDSLVESLATPPWHMSVATTAGRNRSVNHGFGGFTSGAVASEMEVARLAESRSQTCIVWAGNNDGITDPSSRDIAIINLRQIVQTLIKHGARQVIVLNCPNRSPYGWTDTQINDRTADLEALNTLISALCTELTTAALPITYVDVWDAFATGNYAPTAPYVTEDAADMVKRITPRSARDVPGSPSSTHYNQLGDDHIAAWVAPYVI